MTSAKRPLMCGIPGHSSDGRRRPCSARRGVTLIELMVVLTGVSLILGLCAVAIQLLMRVNGDARARLYESSAFARLASQFREDVHDSDGIRFATNPKATASLRLTRGTGTVIEYAARDGRVARDEVHAGKPGRHESYLVGKGRAVAFERRDDGPRRFAVLIVNRASDKNPTEPPRPIEVLALQGKDRHEASKSSAKGAKPR